MGIKQEIFEEFFEKLEKDEEISNLLVAKLRELWKSGDMNSREEIFKAIKMGCENADQN